MSERRSFWFRWPLAASLALALAACGGNDTDVPGSVPPAGAPTAKGSFTAVVSFGDSLSDVGTYAPGTSLAGDGSAPYLGGRFTTNGPGAAVWVEQLATSMGLLVTPAMVGFGTVTVPCPAAAQAAALAATCTGHGQGGARVTDPNGIGRSAGALTVPVKTQIANHLARFGSFKASDLVLVMAGNNDGFIQLGSFGAAAAQIQADAAAGRISADDAKKALFSAQNAAQGEMKKAAQELAGYVRSEILAKGATYVAVLLTLDPASTPFGASAPADLRPVMTALNDTFNLWLKDGLAGQPVKLIDPNVLVNDLLASPSKYGFSNVTGRACDATLIAAITGGLVVDGSSLFCNATPGVPFNGLAAGASATAWMFADSVHPTTGGHRALATYVTDQLKSFGWI
ncbi:MAG: SGNH/GDSL hydrolase family protein [Rubrivivax sp.]|nr:SGNH/GDSL hydrolase family protein [Rubrivivax sp.]